MENNTQRAQFRFVQYRIEEANFRIDGSKVDQDNDMSVNLGAAVECDNEKGTSAVTLEANISNHGESFRSFVKLTGNFESANTKEDELLKFSAYNGIAILFPYLRAYVTTMTAQAGIQPIIIPTLNLQKMGDDIVNGKKKEDN